jgi:hypothetical protein
MHFCCLKTAIEIVGLVHLSKKECNYHFLRKSIDSKLGEVHKNNINIYYQDSFYETKKCNNSIIKLGEVRRSL